mmetsp:Transcript_5093/g.12296  ORF Transcript_5093/g.12296 Transcript_5093/m.12296 type:complete len:363 (-) Transcript_5093:989-2077(-)
MDRENVAGQYLFRLEIDISRLLQEPGIPVRIIVLLEIVNNHGKRTSSPHQSRSSVRILHRVVLLNPRVPVASLLPVEPSRKLTPRFIHPRKAALLEPRVIRREVVQQAASPLPRVSVAIRPFRITDNERCLLAINKAHGLAGYALVALTDVVHQDDRAPGRRSFGCIGPPSPHPSMGGKHEVVAGVMGVATGHGSRLEEQKRRLRVPAAARGHDSPELGKVSQRLFDLFEMIHQIGEFFIDPGRACIRISAELIHVKRVKRDQKIKEAIRSIGRPDILPRGNELGIDGGNLSHGIDPIRDDAVWMSILESQLSGQLGGHLGFENEFASPRCHHSQHEFSVKVVSPFSSDYWLAVSQQRNAPH